VTDNSNIPEIVSPDPQPQAKPLDIYGIYCGEINQVNSQKLVNQLTLLINGGVKRLHLLFQSSGGFPGDAVFLYNTFRAIPLEVILYNAGQVRNGRS
jgi:ATP-dependent protease ClpP protease subunit